MLQRVDIRSRLGNVILGALGILYAVGAGLLLVWFISDAWYGASTTDRALQLVLIGAAAASIWMVRIAARNLGIRNLRHS